MENSVVCPVCTLYLRPGMTLKSHLESHPKQKVIEALVKLHAVPQNPQDETTATSSTTSHGSQQSTNTWVGQSTASTTTYIPATIGQPVIHPAPIAPQNLAGNHSFFYQQIIGSSAQPQGGYLIPVFNQPIQTGIGASPGYMYQQQQMFVSSGTPPVHGGNFPLRMLSIAASDYKGPHIVEIKDQDTPGRNELHAEEEVVETATLMPNLKPQEQMQNTAEVLIAADCNGEFPPDLNPEVPEEEFQDKYKVLENCPKYITLGTATEQAIDAAVDASHQALDQLDGLNIIPAVAEECEEGISIDSAHIRADENMPQESNSNASWSRVQFNEGSSRMSTYDLLARESWEGSDASDVEAEAPPPYENHYSHYSNDAGGADADDLEYDDGDVMISSTSLQGIEYKCSSCPMSFICPKERRVHQAEVHGSSDTKQKEIKDSPASTSNVIGGALYNKKVKKLVIKPKSTKVKLEQLKVEKVEPSFDQIFTNIMKVEDERLAECDASVGGDTLNIDRKSLNLVPQPIQSASAPAAICVLCCSVVRDSSTLRQHQVEMHTFAADTKYKCGVCGECFGAEPAYTEHLAVHPLECLFCGKYFHRAHNMQMHIKRHLGILPYHCLTCGKNFLTRQKLHEHQYVHTGEAPLKCSLCEMTFKRYSNLIQHRNRRHLNIKRKQKDFICATCGDVFHSKKKLAWHKEVHDNRPKACLHCSEKFVHQSSLTRHVRRAHNERFVPAESRDSENVECPICKSVYLRGSLDTHMKSHTARKGFACSVCDKEFSTKWNLKLHKWTHAGRAQKPFKCELCKGAFVREADYTAHMNSHRAIRPYTCNYCGAQFIRKYNCQRHVKEHERNKTFNCNMCGKTFHRSYYLKDHMRIHSGLRPFSCHICGKTSTTKSNHNKHVRIHHAREPVSTEN